MAGRMLIDGNLQVALEELYRSFAKYPLAQEVPPCSCCHDPADEKQLHARPLRQLTHEHLGMYAMDSLYTWGDVNDFRHFLPRLFELVTINEDFRMEVNPEILFSKLTYAEWRTWPEDEQQAITAFLRAWWQSSLDTPPENLGWRFEIEDVICSIAQAEHDLSFYLDFWLNADNINAFHHLALIITQSGILQRKGPGPSAFWERLPEQLDQLSRWLQADAVKKKLLHCLNIWPDIPFAAEAELAIALLP